MPRPPESRTIPLPVRKPILAIAIVLAVAMAAIPAVASAGGSKIVAKKGTVAALKETVLTNTKGHTLYSLSAERHGRFICTGGCEMTWHPLLVAKGVKPKGPVALGTIMRPNGRTQVTYKGLPLYAFSGDTKAGEANGEGFKDVGTWHAAAIGKLGSQPQPEPEPSQPYTPPY